ncbi:MAG: hypothetical protein J6A30_07315, partial [Ruminococcus sp.]|nr:hypothetical protein [Ruminococcus sp.]
YNGIDKFSCTLFCPIGQNELDINECDAQIPHIVKNLRSPNEVRDNNRLTAVIEDTLIITHFFYDVNFLRQTSTNTNNKRIIFKIKNHIL